MKHAFTIAAAMLGGAPALAGGPVFVPVPLPPIAAPVQDWTGPYIGVQAGLANGLIPVDVTGGPSQDISIDGTIYGLHAGYNFDLGSYVIGAELDYNIGQVEAVSSLETSTEDVILAHAKARVGYDLGSVLVYGATGLAYFEATSPGNQIDDTGYFAGLGADVKLSENWTAGAEYLYHVFDEFAGDPGDPDLTLHTVMARVSYHF